MTPLVRAQLEQLGKTLAARNSQPVALFTLPQVGESGGVQTPVAAPERPAEPFVGSSGPKYRHLPPPDPSEALSARAAVAETLSHEGIRTALYCTEARDKLIAEARALAVELRACSPTLEARRDRRAALRVVTHRPGDSGLGSQASSRPRVGESAHCASERRAAGPGAWDQVKPACTATCPCCAKSG